MKCIRICVKFLLGFLILGCTHIDIKRTELAWKDYRGGLSGLDFDHAENNGSLVYLWSVTDRGPNGPVVDENRPFLEPHFQPEIVLLKSDLTQKKIEIVKKIPLTTAQNKAVTGLPNKKNQDEIPVDLENKSLAYDVDGLDTEAIKKDKNGFFWLSEEYRPSLLKINPQGKILKRYMPGKELPWELNSRKKNRGIEALAIKDQKIWFTTQSPLELENCKEEKYFIFWTFNMSTEKIDAAYLLKQQSKKIDKIGDLAVDVNGNFWMIEQDGDVGPHSYHKIVQLNFEKATNVVAEKNRCLLKNKSVVFAERFQEIDLVKHGFEQVEKAEGLTQLPNQTWVAVSDNDFGVTTKEGKLTFDETSTTKLIWIDAATHK